MPGERLLPAAGGTSCARHAGRVAWRRASGPSRARSRSARKALATEAVMLGLRTTAGIDLDAFAARYGLDLLAANDALVARLAAEGHLVVSDGPEGHRRLVPTLSGLAVADGLAAAFDIPLPR